MRMPYFKVIGVSLLTLVAAQSHPAPATGQLLFRPVPSGYTGVHQFTFQIPLSPAMTAANHYLLVDDFPETHVGIGISTGYINLTPSTAKSELFWVASTDSPAGMQFTSCRIRANMLANGLGTTPTYLVVKQGATQSDGAVINVNTNYLVEYSRDMPLNPITNLPWNGDELEGGIIIGIKNAPATIGVGFADIALECQ